MGYETELIVGKQSTLDMDEGIYFSVYATIDMCKCGYESALYNLDWKHGPDDGKPVYWYAPTGDGNTTVNEDRYGDIPKPIPIKDVIAALEEDMAKDDYRRFKWAHAMLSSMADDPEELTVLLWGY